MTSCIVAQHFDPQPQGVLVAVGAHLDDVLEVAQVLPFFHKALRERDQ